MPVVLLTGFAPFGGEDENPSQAVVRTLDGEVVAGHRIVGRELPVVFGESLHALRHAIGQVRPALVVCVGQAGGRANISLERVAINVDDARIPDNTGAQPIDRAVVAGGPAAYFTRLPVKAMLVAMTRAGIPTEVSQTAGTFVCNHVFYGLMHALRRRRTVRGGFIHIPYSAAQAARHPGQPGLPVETMVSGIRIAVEAALSHAVDVAVTGGAEH